MSIILSRPSSYHAYDSNHFTATSNVICFEKIGAHVLSFIKSSTELPVDLVRQKVSSDSAKQSRQQLPLQTGSPVISAGTESKEQRPVALPTYVVPTSASHDSAINELLRNRMMSGALLLPLRMGVGGGSVVVVLVMVLLW